MVILTVITEVASFINEVGFPIAMSIALLWLLVFKMRELTDHVRKMCNIQAQLLKISLRNRRQQNGGLEKDEEKVLSKLERESAEL